MADIVAVRESKQVTIQPAEGKTRMRFLVAEGDTVIVKVRIRGEDYLDQIKDVNITGAPSLGMRLVATVSYHVSEEPDPNYVPPQG
jgi:hypothetical protein